MVSTQAAQDSYENENKFTMQLQNKREQFTRNETAHTTDIKSQKQQKIEQSDRNSEVKLLRLIKREKIKARLEDVGKKKTQKHKT